jgi:flagellar assembly factor FliW
MGRILTTRFGAIEYGDANVIRFCGGLLGFEQYERYVLMDSKGSDLAFRWLQSVDDPALAFLLCDPTRIIPDYCPPVQRSDLSMLALDELRSAIIMCIVTVPEDPELATANFQAPLVINASGRLGKQVITGLPSYKTRQSVFAARKQKAG